MKSCFSNATVMWNEFEITRRESLIREIPTLLLSTWRDVNPAVKMARVETPILTPEDKLTSHIATGFNLIKTEGTRGYLRPETTVGTYEAFNLMFPQVEMLKKRLPFCVWQVGCSFRDEKTTDTMRASKLRLVQFYQMEFQLFTAPGTMSPYLELALGALTRQYGGSSIVAEDLPHYSEKTLDWELGGLEVAGCSVRKDWEHGKVFEIAIGLDRLVALQTARIEAPQ